LNELAPILLLPLAAVSFCAVAPISERACMEPRPLIGLVCGGGSSSR
jgi:hypothetical protein